MQRLFLKKKRCFEENSVKEKRKYIPTNVRRLLRKKLNLSKKLLESTNWKVNYDISEKIEEVELSLEEHYKKRQMDVEKEVIQKMEKNPKIFYSHCKKFNKTSSQIGDLKTNYGVATSDIDKAEELSRQYASVWSKPSKIHCSEDMESFFEKCKDCENQRVHFCKHDDVLEHIAQYRELIMKMDFNMEYGKLSKIHNYLQYITCMRILKK